MHLRINSIVISTTFSVVFIDIGELGIYIYQTILFEIEQYWKILFSLVFKTIVLLDFKQSKVASEKK